METKSSKDIKKVTEKSNKADILEALNQALELLKEKENAVFNPEKIAKENAKTEVIRKAEVTITSQASQSISEKVRELQDSITAMKDLFLVEDVKEKYNSINEAIALKEAELKQIFGVEKELLNLTALINAQDEAREKFIQETKLNQESAEAEYKTLVSLHDAKLKELEKLIADKKAQFEEEKKKQEAEYEYDFKRKKKVDADAWEDEKRNRARQIDEAFAARMDEIKEARKELQEREEKVESREAHLDDLEQKVNNIPNEINGAVAKAIEDTEKKAKQAFNYEKIILETKSKADINLLQSENETLKKTIDSQMATIKALETKLDEAYKEIKDVATKTVDGATASRYMSNLEKMISEGNKSSSNGK